MKELSALNNITGIRGTEGLQKPGVGKVDKGFGDILKGQLGEVGKTNPTQATSGVKFSAHAIERMRTRGISFDQDMLKRLDEAVDKAALKGAKESLILTDDSALIVSVKNKTVITAVDKAGMKENVFTNIDSTIVL